MERKSDKLGTVCVGCWKDILKDEDIFYDEDGQPFCEECYENLVGFDHVDEDAGSVRRDEKRKQGI